MFSGHKNLSRAVMLVTLLWSLLPLLLQSEAAGVDCAHPQCSTLQEPRPRSAAGPQPAANSTTPENPNTAENIRTLPLAARLQLAEAKALYRKAVDDDANARERAVTMFTQLAEQYPEHTTIRAYLGSVHLLEAKSTWLVWRKYRLSLEGLSLLDAAVAQAPDDLEARFIRGVTTYHLPGAARRSEQSAADLQLVATRAPAAVAAGQLDPTLAAAALYYHGLCRAARSDLNGARAAWQAACVLAPTSPAGRQASSRLRMTATGNETERLP